MKEVEIAPAQGLFLAHKSPFCKFEKKKKKKVLLLDGFSPASG